MTDYSPQYVPVDKSNTLGIAGFICSILGVLSCGLLGPVGAILSAVALRREPRGFAIAGLIVGLLASIWLVLGGLLFIGVCASLAAAGISLGQFIPFGQTLAEMEQARLAVNAYIESHDGELPVDLHALLRERGVDPQDAWESAFRIEATARGFRIRSAGPDARFESADDLWIDSSGDIEIGGGRRGRAETDATAPDVPAPTSAPRGPRTP